LYLFLFKRKNKGGNKQGICWFWITGEFKFLLNGYLKCLNFSLFSLIYIIFFLLWQTRHDGLLSRVETWNEDARGMSYLPDRTRQALNKNARVKLDMHEAKPCICSVWFLAYLSSHGTKERCMRVGVIVRCSLVVFLFPANGYWTTNTRGVFKEFWKEFIIALRLVIHIHA
jgi:hypothetical protein